MVHVLLRALVAAGFTGAGAGAPPPGRAVPSLAAMLAPPALLQHPSSMVAARAASALAALLRTAPALAPGLLPVLLASLRTATAARDTRRTAALLRLLPVLCSEPTSAALVWRAATPLTAAGAGGTAHGHAALARTISLRLAVDSWSAGGGSGWARAEAAINGCCVQLDRGPGVPLVPHQALQLLRAEALWCAAGGNQRQLYGTAPSGIQQAAAASAARATACPSLLLLHTRFRLIVQACLELLHTDTPLPACLRLHCNHHDCRNCHVSARTTTAAPITVLSAFAVLLLHHPQHGRLSCLAVFRIPWHMGRWRQGRLLVP